ncbi:aldehyde dehydrogenase [Chryseobacterium indoltheticum]|uniref:Aldehyde dehydrogenase n=1 Tax=Chryseobacterium indoltheticum TaxID=254 RepID=A0A381FGV6_9FLAO|nr:aldehyde dehydrogenase [Chryseobacterium indoltheticum]AZA74667.1 aldehyde dehydrogenase [Chryseobacterium indoltheticum]SIQ39077.1 aldehyde dehydrogenase (NAD+) [Chryseobacterium indoltheticum]SUX45780.1 Coniferyl aldehyde dehydrogenase [Chryseobacterium indoltheticum]
MEIQEVVSKQKAFFKTQQTKNIRFRKMYLEKLRDVILQNENLLYEAIYKDFGKSKFDTFTTEISFILNDIKYYLKNLKSLSKPKKVRTNLVNQIGKSRIHSEPLGNILVIGAWNYPYQLSLSPIVVALAAGNSCILKPSEIAENTMKAMVKIINENFPPEYLFAYEGGIDETTELLKLKFDKIFFTGSTKVGNIVYKAAAENLTPVVLELGGKSPAIITKDANLEVAAKRIIWGKFLNAGQTCVAPDYLLVEESVQEQFLEMLRKNIQQFKYEPESEHYTKIINKKNFERLIKLVNHEKIYVGGEYDEEKLYIEPTILTNINWKDDVMQEEIFGPILPVISFTNFNLILNEIIELEKPLAAYLFTNNAEEKESFTNKLSFGGGCINDVMMHLGNENLPFGGVGNSGIGNYHGKFGFETFSHQKAVLQRATWGEPDIKYPPYSEKKLGWIKKFM